MYVVFIHGPAAAGKYTIGKLASEQLGIPLLHNHLAVDLAATLFDFGTPPFAQLRAELWRTSFRAAADADQSFVFTFHPEATVQPELIEELVELVEAAAGKVYFVALQCSEATVLQRIDTPGRKRFGKLQDRALYQQIAAAGGFDFPPLPQPLINVDTEQQSAAAAADQIVGALAATGQVDAPAKTGDTT